MLHICINHYTIIIVEPDKTEAVVDKEKDLTPISKELNEKEKKDKERQNWEGIGMTCGSLREP